jgi:hypothetical protein
VTKLVSDQMRRALSHIERVSSLDINIVFVNMDASPTSISFVKKLLRIKKSPELINTSQDLLDLFFMRAPSAVPGPVLDPSCDFASTRWCFCTGSNVC